MKTFFFTTVAIFFFSLFSVSVVFAQSNLPCGNIIGPENDSKSIEDCADPFKVTADPSSPYTLVVDGKEYQNGATVPVVGGETNEINASGTPTQMNYRSSLYKHDGNDYRYFDLEASEITLEYYESYILVYFSDTRDRDLYLQIIRLGQTGGDISAYIYNDDGTDKIDENTGETVLERLQNFYESAENDFVPISPKAGVGTYTLVITEYSIYQTNNSIWDKVQQFIIPTAYAQFLQNFIYTITFTITEVPTEPAGASSVLFLPGIMGSRLYEESDICGTGIAERERWMSTTDCHQIRLLTGMYGDSLNDIYTKDTDQAVIDEAYVFNLYKTFFGELSDWKEEGIIKDYALVPYDWRMRLDYLLKTKKDAGGRIKYDPNSQITDSYLYKTLKDLADNSNTGKVTIVAHSNGGLLAKTLLATLENMNDPILDKIDNVILVGSPQLGTPSTLLGMLHGDEIGPYGSIVSQLTTRRLMNAMPFAFHLLPNASYFNSSGVTVDTPVIKFESGALTTGWVNSFGSVIDSDAKLKNFLTIDSGRTKPLVNDLVSPEVVPKYLFDNYTGAIDELMNTWVPPISMNVYQIAGVGLPTQAGITYFTDRECISRDILKLFKCTAYKNKLGFRPDDTIDGDETVVTPSALALSDSNDNVQRLWLNLKNYNNDSVFDRRHKDMLEVQDVINFVKNTITLNTNTSYDYLSSTVPSLPKENRLTFDLHSPLDLSVVTTDGEVISSSTNTIDGAIYRRFGELQYISIPDTSIKKTVKLTGKATGSFTLEIGEQNGTVITKRHTYSAIPSSTSTKVILELETNKPIEQAALTVDYDGNGTAEIVYNTTGEVVLEITYITLKVAINGLNIKSIYKNLLLENLKVAEQYQQKSKFKSLERLALEVLKQQVILYEKLKVLSPAQKQQLIDIINKLLSK